MSKIEWTNKTWNPITGCNKKSEGCLNCYAEKMHKRLTAMGQEKYKFPFDCVRFHYEELGRNLGKKPKMFFVNSMSDTFNEKITDEQIDKILITCNKYPQHVFQVLTKRSERISGFIYPKNVWLGVTVELPKYKTRIDDLRKTDAKIKFLSCEPLLGDLGELDLTGIDWVICGGESGPNARPMNPDWVRNIQKQCKEQGVAFFFKQWGEWLPAYPNLLQSVPHYIVITSYEKVKHQVIVKNMSLDFIEKNFKIHSWGDGFACLISLKLGKSKAGALLDGVEYKEFPNYIVDFGEMEI